MPGVLAWGYYPTTGVWLPIQVDANGRVKADMTAINLDDLADVSVATPTDGYVLYWDAATSLWKCKAVSGMAVHGNEYHNPDYEEVGVAAGLDAYLVAKSLYDAYSILMATEDNTPIALTVATQTLVGRITGGTVASLTVAQVKALLDWAADITTHAALTTGVHGVGASYIPAAPAASHLVRAFTKGWTSGKLLVGAGVDANPSEVAPNLYIPGSNASNILVHDAASSSPFSALINGTPTATSVVYDTDTNENFLGGIGWSYQTSTKVILWNTTRGTSRVVTGINVATNTITTASSADSWANNDAITTQSQTNAQAGYCDIDVSGYLTANSVGIAFQAQVYNTVAGFYYMQFHPFEAYNGAKAVSLVTNLAASWIYIFYILPVISGKITINIVASGAATFHNRVKYLGRIDSQ